MDARGEPNNDGDRGAVYEGIALDVFVGRTPEFCERWVVTRGLVSNWKQYGLLLDVVVSGRGLKSTRLGLGARSALAARRHGVNEQRLLSHRRLEPGGVGLRTEWQEGQMRNLWILLKIVAVLAIAMPLGLFALALTIGVVGTALRLAVIAFRLAGIACVGYGLYRGARFVFGSRQASPPRARELPPADPCYEAAMREIDSEIGRPTPG